MSAATLRRDYANSLLADLQLSSAASLPRREAITDWLRDFLKPGRPDHREADGDDVTNLLAIHAHFRAHAVLGAARPALA